MCTHSELIFRTSLMKFVVFELYNSFGGLMLCKKCDIRHMKVMWKDVESFLFLNLFS
jgi:hypothetical protein